MPRLLRKIARTAVAAGTATVVSNRISHRQAGRWSRDAEPADDEEQPGAEQPPGDDMSIKIDQLRELGELRTQGVLTDAEFDQQKARILGG